jgi:hypothetical protein
MKTPFAITAKAQNRYGIGSKLRRSVPAHSMVRISTTGFGARQYHPLAFTSLTVVLAGLKELRASYAI